MPYRGCPALSARQLSVLRARVLAPGRPRPGRDSIKRGTPLISGGTGLTWQSPAASSPAIGTPLHMLSCVQLSEGDFQVVCPDGMLSRFSGVVKVQLGYG